MKQKYRILPYTMLIFGFSSMSFARPFQRNAGMTVRGSFWQGDQEHTTSVHVDDCGSSEVNVGKAGGWITFYNRMDEKWFMELGLGGAGRVRVKEKNWYSEEIHVSGIAPIVLGILYYPMGQTTQNGLQPFYSFGAGPYWVTSVDIKDNKFSYNDCVTTHTQVKPGIYLGGGANFMLSTWFGFVLDFKYHMVNLDFNHDESGLELAMGFSFFWGVFDA